MEDKPELPKRSRKNDLYFTVAILVVVSIAFRILNEIRFEQGTLLFIGIPALLTILIIKYSGTPNNAFGTMFKIITLFLLMSGILFGEGIICIIMAAPIFYAVGAVLVLIYKLFKGRDQEKTYGLAVIPILLILGEAHLFNSPPELQQIKTEISMFDSATDLSALNHSPADLQLGLSSFFKMGFPKPMGISGTGLEIGDQRQAQFLSQTKGMGSLTLAVIERTENSVTFDFIKDDTHIGHWLTWESAKIQVDLLSNGKTRIIWTTNFYCDLGPRWYFLPIERYAVDEMNKHLIHTYFNVKNY